MHRLRHNFADGYYLSLPLQIQTVTSFIKGQNDRHTAKETAGGQDMKGKEYKGYVPPFGITEEISNLTIRIAENSRDSGAPVCHDRKHPGAHAEETEQDKDDPVISGH